MGLFANTLANTVYKIGAASLFSAGLFAVFCPPANAACFPGGCSQNGLVFSEASNSFKITNVTGLGTSAKPFVIHQDVWGLDISLAVSGLKLARHHSVFKRPGFAISIVSRNLTGAFWRFYDHELQETAGYASSENDGLSFAQGIGAARPYRSSHYAKADEITDVRDFINFYQGHGVQPGQTVRFNYFVTDTIPNHRFYIRQRPDYRKNTVPTAAIAPKKQSKPRPQQPKPAAPPKATVPSPKVASKQPSYPAMTQKSGQPSVTPPPAKKVPQPISQLKTNTAMPQSVPEPSMTTTGALALLAGGLIRSHKSCSDN